jgi:uncharacterized protein YjbI with pentapeptide repeats
MKQGWIKYLLYLSAILVVGGLVLFLVGLGYSYSWTGFGEFAPANPDTVRSKTLWDWMELLIIPAVLAGGAILLNRSERTLERKTAEDRSKLERDLATDRQREAAIQTYFDRMSELLLNEKLRTTENVEVRDVARTRTISSMRVMDTNRNKLILQFLSEAKLITGEKSIFNRANMNGMNLEFANLERADLEGANLVGANLQSANLQGANLQGANLKFAHLQKANLVGANLQSANLQGANLQSVNLQNANLVGAVLQSANLQGANLWNAGLASANLVDANLRNAGLASANLVRANLVRASLYGANLEDADLREANLEGADLRNAKNLTAENLAFVNSLKCATMPDGTRHD